MREIPGCEVLLEVHGQPGPDQMARSGELNEAFKILVSHHPTEEEFVHYMGGTLLTATMLYHAMHFFRGH